MGLKTEEIFEICDQCREQLTKLNRLVHTIHYYFAIVIVSMLKILGTKNPTSFLILLHSLIKIKLTSFDHSKITELIRSD